MATVRMGPMPCHVQTGVAPADRNLPLTILVREVRPGWSPTLVSVKAITFFWMAHRPGVLDYWGEYDRTRATLDYRGRILGTANLRQY